jgi:O-antigen/teichoic acid export membrane protein
MLARMKRAVSALLPRGSVSRITALVVLGDAILYSSGTITSIVLARIIPVDAMATYRQVVYLTPLAQNIVEFGLASSIYRFWNLLTIQRRSTFLKMLILLSIGLGTIASLGLAALTPFISSSYHNPDLLPALLICSIFPLLNILPLAIRPLQICRGRPLLATALQLVISLLNVFSLVIPLMLGYSLLTALKVWILTDALNFAIVPFVFLPSLLPGTPWWDKELFKEIWDYLWPLQAGRIPTIFTQYTDKIASSLYLTKEVFATYSLGAKEIPFIGQIGTSISNVLVPKLVEDVSTDRVNQALARWRRACERTAIFTYPIAGFCIFFSLPIVRLLYSSTYTASSIPFMVYAFLTFIRVIDYGSLAKVFGKTRIIMRSSIISAASLVVLSFPLTALFGIWGISLTVLFSVIINVGVFMFSYIKALKVDLNHLYPWKQLLALMGFSMASAGVLRAALYPLISDRIAISAINAVIFLTVLFGLDIMLYAGLLWVTKNQLFIEYRNKVVQVFAAPKP